jgi:uncharacterized protein (DUF1786 family)
MKILALDIGAGTEDVLLYDDAQKSVENCVKMVLPAPSRVFADRVRSATHHRKDLFVTGATIGGGAFAHALTNHVASGLQVFITTQAAYTVRNDLDEVRQLGMQVTEEAPEGFRGETITIEEVNVTKLQGFLAPFGEPLSDVNYVAVAVQDHGVFPRGASNRRFRIKTMKELLERDPKPETLAFWEDEIPPHFKRMKAAAQAARRQVPDAQVLVMDTSLDAILGCLVDPVVGDADPVLVLNVGNGHTIAAIISNAEVGALMEHHTRLLPPPKLERLLRRFADGTVSDAEVFQANGHGLFFLTGAPGFTEIQRVVATGPNRGLLAETALSVHYAAPGGDVMMTGPIGLAEAIKRKKETRKGQSRGA